LALVGAGDELWSGVAVVAAPSVEREQSIGHGRYVLAVFVLPFVLSSGIDAALALLSDRVARRGFVAAALGALSASLVLSALAQGPWLLSGGLALAGAASGAACGGAQAELLSLHPGSPDRAMTRWTLFASVGDVIAPLFVSALLASGFSYRTAFVAIAVLIGVQAVIIARSPISKGEGTDDDEAATIDCADDRRRWLREPWLWAWLFGAAICSLLDELVAAMAALRIRHLGASEAVATACITAFSVGSVLGALATDFVLSHLPPRRVLVVSALVSIAMLLVVAWAPAPLLLIGAMILLGVAAEPHYPLAKARAYETLPRSPGLVNAVAQVFIVIDIVAPLAVGAVADQHGLQAALACLLVQPVVILTLAVARGRQAT
jgi:MFS family permease